MRENGLARVHDAEQVGLNGVDPRFGRLIYKWSDGARNSSGADQHIHFAVMDAHAVDGGIDLLEVGDVGSNAERVAAGVFDLQVRQVQLGFAARQQRHAISRCRKPDRQPLADASPGSRNKHTGVGQSFHRADSFQFTLVQRERCVAQARGSSQGAFDGTWIRRLGGKAARAIRRRNIEPAPR